MTLTAAATSILAALQSGRPEQAEQLLLDLDSLLATKLQHEDLASAKHILETARIAARAHRAHIIQQLQQLEKSDLYSASTSVRVTSWELSG